MDDRETVEILWQRWQAGEALSADEQRTLGEALRDESLRQEMLEDAQVEGLLQALPWVQESAGAFGKDLAQRLSAEQDAGPFVAKVSRRRWRWRLWPLLFSAAGAAALIALWAQDHERGTEPPEASFPASPRTIPRTSSPKPDRAEPRAMAMVQSVEGTVYRMDGVAKTTLAAGELVEARQGLLTTGPGSVARLVYTDRSRVEVGPDTFVSSFDEDASGARLAFLAAGTLWADVTEQKAKRSFTVVTPHAEAMVLGTRFSLEVGREQTRLRVEAGRVRLRRSSDGRAAFVQAGQQATTDLRGALVAQSSAPGGLALLLVGSAQLSDGDSLIKARLERLGFEAKVHVPKPFSLAETRRSRIILISSTLLSADLDPAIAGLEVPILNWEGKFYPVLGMSLDDPKATFGVSRQPGGEVDIRDPWHAMAGGLSGVVRLFEGQVPLFGVDISPFAIWVATIRGLPQRAALFGYERGALLHNGVRAPARRAGIFLDEAVIPRLTDAGWSLFDAAVRWCAADGPQR